MRHRSRIAASCALALSCSLPIAAHACGGDSYIGSVCFFSSSYCPQDYVTADGSLLPVASYGALFSLLGITYGGNGTTTFGVPDLRGRMAIGVGQGTGLPAVALNQALGQPSVTLQASQVPLTAHTHPTTFSASTESRGVEIPAAASTLAVTATLPASTMDGASSFAPGDVLYAAALKGATETRQLTVSGPYLAKLDGQKTATLAADVAVTGSVGRPASSFTFPATTGGSIAVAQSTDRPVVPVPTQSPGLGMSVCIATVGSFPSRPDQEPTLTPDTQ